MARRIGQLAPTEINAKRSLENRIGQFAQVFMPRESEPPVLHRALRESVHQWLTEYSNADLLQDLGVEPRRRAMFYGPPGTGKTTLAHHIAARYGMPLVVVDTSTVNSKWVSETGNNIAALFAVLRAEPQPVAVLLDELDALAPPRKQQESGGDREAAKSLIALMQHIDRFDGVVIGATNRQDNIDRALWRRFDIHLEIGLPDAECRFAIIRRYLAPLALPDEAIDLLVNVTDQASPALLRQMIEGIKRDMVIAPKLNQRVDAASTIGRIVASVHPSDDMPDPPLWADTKLYADAIASMPWPPIREQ